MGIRLVAILVGRPSRSQALAVAVGRSRPSWVQRDIAPAFPRGEARPIGRSRGSSRSSSSRPSPPGISLRAALTPVLLGVVAGTTQVGYYRVALAPQSGFSAASAPVRLVLLTEQTRDWEHGRAQTVLRGVKRYSLGAAAVALVSVPVFLLAMPWLVRVVFGEEYLPRSGGASSRLRRDPARRRVVESLP
jgi:hypothetical protein